MCVCYLSNCRSRSLISGKTTLPNIVFMLVRECDEFLFSVFSSQQFVDNYIHNTLCVTADCVYMFGENYRMPNNPDIYTLCIGYKKGEGSSLYVTSQLLCEPETTPRGFMLYTHFLRLLHNQVSIIH